MKKHMYIELISLSLLMFAAGRYFESRLQIQEAGQNIMLGYKAGKAECGK